MSLDRALHALPCDRATENTVREVLQYMSRHAAEWVPTSEVARRVEKPEPSVAVILSKLADGYVLDSDGDRYRYDTDPLVDLDVKRFLRKTDVHTQLAQNNLAMFRDRFGHR
jgi:hypothetical protein